MHRGVEVHGKRQAARALDVAFAHGIQRESGLALLEQVAGRADPVGEKRRAQAGARRTIATSSARGRTVGSPPVIWTLVPRP